MPPIWGQAGLDSASRLPLPDRVRTVGTGGSWRGGARSVTGSFEQQIAWHGPRVKARAVTAVTDGMAHPDDVNDCASLRHRASRDDGDADAAVRAPDRDDPGRWPDVGSLGPLPSKHGDRRLLAYRPARA